MTCFHSILAYLTDAENWINLFSYWLVLVCISIELHAIGEIASTSSSSSSSSSSISTSTTVGEDLNNFKKTTLPFLVLDLLYKLSGFRTLTAPFTRKLVGISRGIVIFLMLLVFILVAFTGSFVLLLPNVEDYQRYDTAFMQVFTILFGNFDLTEFYASPSPNYAVALLAVFLFVVIVVLLNLLIAMMGDIQQEIESRIVAETYFAQAKIVLEYERVLVDVTSRRKQALYQSLSRSTGTGTGTGKTKSCLTICMSMLQLVWFTCCLLV
jgi:hypothetical protein